MVTRLLALTTLLVGCAGPAGPTGATGPQGEQGPEGPRGPEGADGRLRIYGDGSAGALEVAEDTTWDAETPAVPNVSFASIHIAPGVTLTVASGMLLRATGHVLIEGTLAVLPYASGASAEQGISPERCSVGGTPSGDTPLDTACFQYSHGGGVGRGAADVRFHAPSGGAFGGGAAAGPTAQGGGGGGQLRVIAQGAITIPSGGAVHANGTTGTYNAGGGAAAS